MKESYFEVSYMPEGTEVMGGYWTRSNDPEIDLVGVDRSPIAKKVTMTGSIKWLENKPFDARDLARQAGPGQVAVATGTANRPSRCGGRSQRMTDSRSAGSVRAMTATIIFVSLRLTGRCGMPGGM